jgi:intracellular sulfur oxidation DsrE/DsrF family protein
VSRLQDRRGFVSRLAAAAGLLVPGAATLAHAGERADTEPWMQGLEGKHRVAVDVATLRDGHPLVQIKAMLDTYRDEYRAEGKAVSLVAAFRGGALPLVLDDATWTGLLLPERMDLRDPRSKALWSRNAFARPGLGAPVPDGATVAALQDRGVRVLACRNTIRGLATRLATPEMSTASVERRLEEGLLPGVTIVPAMVVALARLQERRFAYVYAG